MSPKWMVKPWLWTGWSRNRVKQQRAPDKPFEGEAGGGGGWGVGVEGQKPGSGRVEETRFKEQVGHDQALSAKELGTRSVLGFGGSAFSRGVKVHSNLYNVSVNGLKVAAGGQELL